MHDSGSCDRGSIPRSPTFIEKLMIDFKQQMEQNERYRYPLEEEPRPRKKTKRLFIYLGIFGVIALLFAGKMLASSKSSSGWFKNTFFGGLSHLVINPTTQLEGEENDRINILLLGMGGKNHDGGNLTDTIILLSLIPVLSVIHSSEVSTIFSKSLFVKTFSGTYDPVPKIFTLRFF